MTDGLRVLLVEDSPTDAKLVLHALRSGGRAVDAERVDEAEPMRAALARGGWDLVISDWSMPKFSALAALDVLRASGLDVPFIIVSGTIGEELAVDAMRAGAHDYVLKDRLARLAPAVEREVRESHIRKQGRHAMAALRISEARYRRLWDSGLILITISDMEGNIKDVNDAGAEMLGYSRVEMLAGTVRWSELTPLEWRQADDRAIAELDATGVARPFEKELIRKDGDRVAILAGAAVLDESERIAIAVDVTAGKRARDALVERMAMGALMGEIGVSLTAGASLRDTLQRCAQAIVDHLGAAFARVWTLDAKKNELVLQASAGLYTHIDGAHARVPVGWLKIGLIAEEGRPHLTNDVAHDERISDPVWAAREGMVAFAGHPLLVDGELVGVLAMFARRTVSEATLAGLGAVADAIALGIRRDLAESERTELEGQLRQSQKMEAVGRLAGGVAHDFNNMLSVIMSYAELLRIDLPPGDAMLADLEEIQHATSRAADLTRQLLMFSRQQLIEPQVMDLNEVLASMDNMLRRIVGEDVALASTAAPGLGHVHVDRSSIEQVIMNLVVNARDAMPTGGRISIETADVVLDEHDARDHTGITPGPYVMISVTDTGIGMDEDTRARIFEPFFTTKERGKGTGLGLSTVYGIVQQSHGSISVESRRGAGASFRVYLPRAAPSLLVSRPVAAVTTPRGAETILLVEDEDQLRKVACTVLRRSGYRVIEARHADEALALASEHQGPIHLLLTDVVMPKMSGPELAKRLLPSWPDMRVLCMSGYTDDSIVRHGVLSAELAFLQKPITPASLSAKVREVLDANGD